MKNQLRREWDLMKRAFYAVHNMNNVNACTWAGTAEIYEGLLPTYNRFKNTPMMQTYYTYVVMQEDKPALNEDDFYALKEAVERGEEWFINYEIDRERQEDERNGNFYDDAYYYG